MKIFVSSYALTSPILPWDRNKEALLFDGLAQLDLAGLELPYYGRLHAHDENWLISQLRPQWQYILTLLPGTMKSIINDPDFGLASTNEASRKRAIDFTEQARQKIQHLNSSLGFSAVSAVEIHSAPSKPTPDSPKHIEALSRSISELRHRNWHGARLLLEHCDAPSNGRPWDKGFMRLESECTAIKLSSGETPIGLLINWGRSAIETRSISGPLRHIKYARSAGLLSGLFFSGATADDPEYGSWQDRHAPFSISRTSSQLTVEAAKAALQCAEKINYLGTKIQPLPTSLNGNARLEMIREAIEVLEQSRI